MYNPTNAAHLSNISSGGSGGWMIGGESDENIANSAVIHCDIAHAPGMQSQQIAQRIHEKLIGVTLPASESDTTGHVVVIARVEYTNNNHNHNSMLPSKADLLKALGIKDTVDGVKLLNEATLTAKYCAQQITRGFCYSTEDYDEYDDHDNDNDNSNNSNHRE